MHFQPLLTEPQLKKVQALFRCYCPPEECHLEYKSRQSARTKKKCAAASAEHLLCWFDTCELEVFFARIHGQGGFSSPRSQHACVSGISCLPSVHSVDGGFVLCFGSSVLRVEEGKCNQLPDSQVYQWCPAILCSGVFSEWLWQTVIEIFLCHVGMFLLCSGIASALIKFWG